MIGVDGEWLFINSAQGISTKAVTALFGDEADQYGAVFFEWALRDAGVASGAIFGKVAIRDAFGDASERVHADHARLGFGPRRYSDRQCVDLRDAMPLQYWRGIPVTFPGSITTFVGSHVAAVQAGQCARGQANQGNLIQFVTNVSSKGKR